MLLVDLQEDAAQDISMRTAIAKIAARAMNKLYDGVPFDRRMAIPTEPDVVRFTYFPETLNLGSALSKTLISFALKQGRGASGVINKIPPGLGYQSWITVFCLDGALPVEEALKRAGGSLEVRKVLMHELTHFFDDLRTNDGATKNYKGPVETGDSDAYEKSLPGYFNCPAEFNAYYNDIATTLSEVAGEIGKVRTYNEGRDILDLYGLTGDFRHDLVEVMSQAKTTSRLFLKYISAENGKKMRRRLYLLHVEMMRLLNALPNSD